MLSVVDEQAEIMVTLNESDMNFDMKQDDLLANYNKPFMKTFDMGCQISFGNESSVSELDKEIM